MLNRASVIHNNFLYILNIHMTCSKAESLLCFKKVFQWEKPLCLLQDCRKYITNYNPLTLQLYHSKKIARISVS